MRQPVELVFVSACHSQKIGEAFAEAGVPHVIAIKSVRSISRSLSLTLSIYPLSLPLASRDVNFDHLTICL